MKEADRIVRVGDETSQASAKPYMFCGQLRKLTGTRVGQMTIHAYILTSLLNSVLYSPRFVATAQLL
ncbi:hypothetical protein U1Q18_005355, partial [Sarracenia purpurea var. burkii]